MTNHHHRRTALTLLSPLFLTSLSHADVFNLPAATSLQFVHVGDPGNAPDSRVMSDFTSGYGSVPYAYDIAKYDVTVAQYTAFLNAVATASDTYGLYNTKMSPGATNWACGIVQTPVLGGFAYSFPAGRDNFPVNNVSWASAARFANWLTNGQPTTGVENASTTERGSYTLDGKNSDLLLFTITRDTGAKYVLPTEDEWYKAAFYKGGTSNAYWLYATQTDTPPAALPPAGAPAPAANAKGSNLDPLIDPVNGLTPVGAYTLSPSYYGTYDQNGNVWQWNEAILPGGYRGIRGGAFSNTTNILRADTRSGLEPTYTNYPSSAFPDIGFRIAAIPEPTTLPLLALGAILVLKKQKPSK